MRLVMNHKDLDLFFVHSSHNKDQSIADIHPQFFGLTDMRFSPLDPQELASQVDIIFLAIQHGKTQDYKKILEQFQGVVIDLTSDHRSSPDFVYGIPEIYRHRLKSAVRIANPGCFATSVILGSFPILKDEMCESKFTVSSVTGSSGSGMFPSQKTHHPFRDENMFAYKLFEHQHEPEVTHILNNQLETKTNLILTTHSGPFIRGIHSTLFLTLKNNHKTTDWNAYLREFYIDSPFVRVRSEPPMLNNVVGSNFCDLFAVQRDQDLIVISVLDNLIKGAAGQAIQNLNIALGLPEKEGLWIIPPCP